MGMLLYAALYLLMIPVSYHIIKWRLTRYSELKWPALYNGTFREESMIQDKSFSADISAFWPISLPLVIYNTRIKK